MINIILRKVSMVRMELLVVHLRFPTVETMLMKWMHHPRVWFDFLVVYDWFQVIDPQFSTDRTELGIHPDGNLSGTRGCIGLLESDTSAWYDAFKSVPTGSKTDVEVFDRT